MEKCVTSFQKLLPYVIIEYARPLIYIYDVEFQLLKLLHLDQLKPNDIQSLKLDI